MKILITILLTFFSFTAFADYQPHQLLHVEPPSQNVNIHWYRDSSGGVALEKLYLIQQRRNLKGMVHSHERRQLEDELDHQINQLQMDTYR